MDFKKALIVSACILALPTLVLAQGAAPSPSASLLKQELFSKVSSTASSSASAAVVANINLSNITILSQESGKIRIAFDILNNGDTPQLDVRYGIELIKKTSTGQGRADTFVPDETLAIGAKQTLHRELTYTAPSFLSGTYELWVKSKTTGGLTLGVGLAGTVTLSGSQEYVEIIDGPSCFLQLSGDATHYNRGQGVDIKSGEELSFTCTVKNNYTHAISVYPFFEVYERSLYGRITNTVTPSQSLITLAAGENKLVSFIIPKADKPQAYDVNVFLVEQNKSIPVSNKVIVHYVLQGASATIQNVSVDKISYAKGETILARLFWTASADQFPGSRAGTGTMISGVSAKVNVVDSVGVSCADPITETVSQTEKVSTISIVTTKECLSPKVSVTLLDESGGVYDSRAFLSPEGPQKTTQSFQSIGILVGGILILLLVAFFIRKVIGAKKSNRPPNVINPLLLLFIISSGFLMNAGVANAITVDGGEAGYVVNTDKTIYSPGETITLSGTGEYGGCGNGSPTFVEYASLQGDIKTLTSNHFEEWDNGSWNFSTPLFTAPTTAGDYTISVSRCTGITHTPEYDYYSGLVNTYPFGGSVIYGVWSAITSSLQQGGSTIYNRTIPYHFVGFPSYSVDGIIPDSCSVGSLPITVVSPCAANQGASCQSSANACGQTNSGTIQCDGTCGSSVANPAGNYGGKCAYVGSATVCVDKNTGQLCTYFGFLRAAWNSPTLLGKTANSCDFRNDNTCWTQFNYQTTGTTFSTDSIGMVGWLSLRGYWTGSPQTAWAGGPFPSPDNCGGPAVASSAVSAPVAPPQNPAGYGVSCTSSANACGQTNSGTIQCDGTCSATAPSDSSCPVPDLTAGATIATPSSVTIGQSISFSSKAVNIGDGDAVNVPNIFQITTNRTTPNVAVLSTGTVPLIAAGDFVSTSASSGASTFPAPGTYYVRACANIVASTWSWGISESNYNNNCGAWTAVTIGSACASNQFNQCPLTSSANACGQTATSNSGTVQCDGSCTGTAPTAPPNSSCPSTGVCGTANNFSYPYPSSGYSPKTQCSVGSPSNTAFPSAGSSSSWTCSGVNTGPSSGTCSASQGPASCTLPWGGTIADSAQTPAYQASTVTSPASCVSQMRICDNGTLSGTYQNQSCVVNNPSGALSITPPSCAIASGNSTCTVSASWTTGYASGAYLWDRNVSQRKYTANSSSGSIVYVAYPQTVFDLKNGDDTQFDTKTATANCAPGSSWNGSRCVSPCSLPWGGTVADSAQTPAYQASTVTSPASCVSQMRICDNGTLSGTYQNQSCVVAVNGVWSAWSTCTLPCGTGTQVHACVDPAPSNGGLDCLGPSSQNCNTQACPIPDLTAGNTNVSVPSGTVNQIETFSAYVCNVVGLGSVICPTASRLTP